VINDLSLFIGGIEWVIIILLGLILLLGTRRLPQFARTMGKVVGEFQKARRDVDKELEKVDSAISIPISGPVASEREKLKLLQEHWR